MLRIGTESARKIFSDWEHSLPDTFHASSNGLVQSHNKLLHVQQQIYKGTYLLYHRSGDCIRHSCPDLFRLQATCVYLMMNEIELD